MFKKILFPALITTLLFSFAGCASKEKESSAKETTIESKDTEKQEVKEQAINSYTDENLLYNDLYYQNIDIYLLNKSGDEGKCINEDIYATLEANNINMDDKYLANCHYWDGIFYTYIYSKEGDENKGFYALDLKNKKIKKLLDEINVLSDSIDYYNDKLYIEQYDDSEYKEYVYTISDDFTFKQEESENKVILDALSHYSIAASPECATNRLPVFCISRALDNAGYVIAEDTFNEKYVKVFSDGTTEPIDLLSDKFGSVIYYDKNRILFRGRNADARSDEDFSIYKIQDNKIETLPDLTGIEGIEFADNKMYYSKDYTIYEFNLSSEKTKKVFAFAEETGGTIFQSRKGHLYAQHIDNGDIKWCRLDEYAGDIDFTDIGYSIGTVNILKYGSQIEKSKEVKCPSCGATLEKMRYTYFQLKEEYSKYASKINKALRDKVAPFFANEYENDDTCDRHQDPDYFVVIDACHVVSVNIYNSQFLIVLMGNDWEGGGPHGSYQSYEYLFDLNTGEELSLKNFYKGTEKEFKKMVAEKVKEDFKENSEPYFATNVEDAYKSAYALASIEDTLETDVSFEEDCILYSFERYALSSYADGPISVKISYKELNGNDKITRIR